MSTMKKIHVEFPLEGPGIRAIVGKLRELLKEGKVFAVQAKFGSKEYYREAILGSEQKHHLQQPARGLVHNIHAIMGGTDQKAGTAESLETLFIEALAYADAMEKVYITAVEEAQKKYPVIPAVRISRRHIQHVSRSSPHVQHHFTRSRA